jgi:hypothetical protein
VTEKWQKEPCTAPGVALRSGAAAVRQRRQSGTRRLARAGAYKEHVCVLPAAIHVAVCVCLFACEVVLLASVHHCVMSMLRQHQNVTTVALCV